MLTFLSNCGFNVNPHLSGLSLRITTSIGNTLPETTYVDLKALRMAIGYTKTSHMTRHFRNVTVIT